MYERHYTSYLLSTCHRRNSSPAISTSSHDHGLSHDHLVRHPRTTGRTPPPNCVTSIHNRRGGVGILEWHKKHSPRRYGGEWSASQAKETIWSQNLTVDLRRIYLTTRDLASWSQPYHDDKCTKQLISVWILPVNYKRIMNRHARIIDPSTHSLLANPSEWPEILTHCGSQDQWQLISLWRMWGILY